MFQILSSGSCRIIRAAAGETEPVVRLVAIYVTPYLCAQGWVPSHLLLITLLDSWPLSPSSHLQFTGQSGHMTFNFGFSKLGPTNICLCLCSTPVSFLTLIS